MSDPYKEIVVEDFCDPKRRAVFTLETPGDVLMKVKVSEDGVPFGPAVRLEPSALRVIADVMEGLTN